MNEAKMIGRSKAAELRWFERIHLMANRSYRGFVSYCHSDAGSAYMLHRRLEKWEVPKSLRPQNRGNARLGNFFLDREELAANDHLSARIRDALAGSETLIVVCSLNAARSHWVSREITTFRELRPAGAILPVIVGGEPPDCFPVGMKSGDLVAADFRNHADGEENGFFKVVAGLLGVSLTEVKDRELVAQRERVGRARLVAAGFAALSVLTLGASVTAGVLAYRSNQLAAAAIETSGAISDEAFKLKLNSGVTSWAVGQLLGFSIERLEDLRRFGLLSTDLDYRIGWTNTRFALNAIEEGDFERALGHADRAMTLTSDSRRFGAMLTFSSALAAKGQALLGLDRKADAVQASIDAVAVANKMYEAHPDRYQVRLVESEALAGLAKARTVSGDAEQALEDYSRAVRLLRDLLKEFPNSAMFPMRIAENLEAMGGIAEAAEDWVRAAAWYEDALDQRQRFLSRNSGLPYAHMNTLKAALNSAEASLRLGKRESAIRSMEAGVTSIKAFADQHPEDAMLASAAAHSATMLVDLQEGRNPFKSKGSTGQANLHDVPESGTAPAAKLALLSRAEMLIEQGDAHSDAGHFDQGHKFFLEAVELARRAESAHPGDVSSMEIRAKAALLGGASAVDGDRIDEARALGQEARDIYVRLAETHPGTPAYALGSALAEQLLADLTKE